MAWSGQVALSLVLLIAAGLFTATLFNLRNTPLGVSTSQVLSFSVDPRLNGYDTPRTLAFYRQLQDSLESTQGITGATLTSSPLFAGDSSTSTMSVEGYQAKEGENLNLAVHWVAPRYFSTLGIGLLRGRDIAPRDTANSPRVAVINESTARYFFGGSNPLGRRMAFGHGLGTRHDIEIVGVVADSRLESAKDTPKRMAYFPYTQDPGIDEVTFYVRASEDPVVLAQTARATVRRLDPSLPIYALRTLEAQLTESMTLERMVSTFSAGFGALATLLAGIGLYGLVAFSVARRTREIGIRVTLGARRNNVLWLVLREVLLLAGAGIVVGLPLALYLTRFLKSQLYGLSPADPAVAAAATIGVLVVTLAAGYLPARRATGIDPLTALRHE